MTKCESFSAKVNHNSRVLILGSMPGIKSLERAQYYAHPQNRFWKVMAVLCKCAQLPDLAYDDKIKVLLDNNFGLWDTIKFCKREGSLDSDILEEVPNDLKSLLEKYRNIKTICLNGNKSYSVFKKYFPDLLDEYKCIKLPSTSPANARFSLNDLIAEWKVIEQNIYF